jgi:hypothetical protein
VPDNRGRRTRPGHLGVKKCTLLFLSPWLNIVIGIGFAAYAGCLLNTSRWYYGIAQLAIGGLNVGVGIRSIRRRKNGTNWLTGESHTYTEARRDAEHVGGATRRGPRRGTARVATGTRELEGIDQVEPIRAWRGVSLVYSADGITLGAMNSQYGTFGTEATAECKAPDILYPRHGAAPGLNCTCGFYGVKKKLDAFSGAFVAEVDFYGTVIEHERGYRAEYQRVLSLRVGSRRCMGVSGFTCTQVAEVVTWATYWPASCLLLCKSCAKPFQSATLPEVAGQLGVEVRWDTPS